MRGDRPAELVIGSVQLGLPYGVANRSGMPARETALRLVRRAADEGVASFDTARAYGDAESRLGEALAGKRGVETITKLSPLTQLSAGASREAVRAAVDASIEESLAALRVSNLPCVLLHRAGHLTAFRGAVWERLLEHLAAGVVTRLGVSVQSPEEALQSLAHADVRHIQLPFNLLDWRWREAGVIEALRARPTVTVHARSVFLQGMLVANDVSLWPRFPGITAETVLRWLNETTEEFGRQSTADLALAFARGQEWIDGVVVGMETLDQLDVNLRLATRPPLDEVACAKIERTRPRVPEALLDPAQWGRGK